MNDLSRALKALILMISLGTGTASILAQSLDKAAISEKVAVVFNSYLSAFSSGQAGIIANQIYAAPAYSVPAQGPRLSLTSEALLPVFENQIAELATDDFEKTEAQRTNICVLNQSAAIVSATFTRYRSDGSVIGRGAATYFFARFPENWKIVAVTSHLQEDVIRCAE